MNMNDRIDWDLGRFDPRVKDIVVEGLCLYNNNNMAIANHIKNGADKLFGGFHHCIVGRNYSW